jgi:DMSO/TMAO reductase YedYZ heme-binding membrane subunit
MVVPTAILLIVGGICAAAPLFKRVSKGLEKLLVILGFAVGIAVIIISIDLALGLGILSSVFGIGFAPGTSLNPYLKYYLVVMAVLGILLFSRPLRNVRWASLIALGIGILVAAYLHVAFSVTSTTILGIVFIVIILIVYTLLRFIEDILGFIGTVLAFPPIAIAIGLVSIYFGIITFGT